MSDAVCCDPTISLKMQPKACKMNFIYANGVEQEVDYNNTLCVNAASKFAIKTT
jgi:hypothetical protein